MLSSLFFITALALISLPQLSAGGKLKNDESAIQYVELGFNQGIYEGIIQDTNQEIPLTRISFAGDAFLNGVKKESDNSHNHIELAEIEYIKMIDPLFESIRYPQQEYSLVEITTTSGQTEEMLMPRHLTICGIAPDTHIKKAWALRTISSIRIIHDQQS